MAARTGCLFQDHNLSAQVDGAATVSGKVNFSGQRKAIAGGRKPLGDLSNTRKPLNQDGGKKVLDGSLNSGKQVKSHILMNDERVASKVKNLGSNRRTASKVLEKSHTGSRKALSDISNSGKPHVAQRKNTDSLKKLSSLTEEPLHPSAIAEEKFLHNHKKCLKSQFEAVDVHQIFKTVGLENDSDDDLTISFEPPANNKLKSESAYLELEEVPELLPEVQSTWKKQLPSTPHGSPVHCQTLSLSTCCTMLDDVAVNFKLIDTPKLSKN